MSEKDYEELKKFGWYVARAAVVLVAAILFQQGCIKEIPPLPVTVEHRLAGSK